MSNIRAIPADRTTSPAEFDEERLVEGFVAGDRSAFDRLVDRYQPRVAGMVYRLLGWPEDIDDVVQDVFVAVLKGLPSFRREARFSSWLTRIVVNTCRSQGRRRRLVLRWFPRLQAKETVLDGLSHRAVAEQLPLADREVLDRIRTVVRQMPEIYREVVVLRYLEQMSSGEVAEVLAVSINTVEARLHRARKRLRELLGDLADDGGLS
ncbi:MAG TPA: sigma-70 family RNA polymerase sigma factor [Phycisphaerae bacterium]|nr:sigma-70 family RNA polymerase sigma factor [Phycisphaerae bacterium]HRY68476.1 sigma-70 family RNA polymerase sigma factor [Phycisphaerae bacterium]HSA29529.1 sigma-70 family RNA polymerase sigma factor [Phycisphaerae bacterium]